MSIDIKVDKPHASFASFASLPEGLVWTNIPDFAVLTGSNGCGKTHLLRFIQYTLSQKDSLYKRRNICLIHETLNLQKSKPSNIASYQQELINSLKQHKSKPSHSDQHTASLIEIAESIGKNIQKLEEHDVINLVPEPISTGEQLKKSLVLHEIYRTMKIVHVHDSTIGDKFEKINDLAPYELINNLLNEYGSDFVMEKPNFSVNLSIDNLDFDIIFYNKATNNKIRFNELSTGEQSLIQIFMTIYSPNSINSTKILLLDEIDRHLHPSSCNMLIKILYEKFVKEYGIKIILASHCLATIAFCPEESLFLMEKGGIEIRKTSKEKAMKSISDDILSFEDGIKIINQISTSSAPVILLVEGKFDIMHITIAKEKLNISSSFDIVSCDSASKLKSFITSIPPSLFKNITIIGIFDLDQAGLNGLRKFGHPISSHQNIHKSNDHIDVYAITLPPHDPRFEEYKNMPIEYLYDKSILDSLGIKLKKIHVNRILSHNGYIKTQADYDNDTNLWLYELDNNSEKQKIVEGVEKLDALAFQNFIPLFELIEKIAAFR